MKGGKFLDTLTPPTSLPDTVAIGEWLSELVGTLQSQLDMVASGAAMLPYEYLTKRYLNESVPLGATASFQHETNGTLTGKFVKLGAPNMTGFARPVGYRTNSSQLYEVTDRVSESSEDLFAGLDITDAGETGEYGWILTGGVSPVNPEMTGAVSHLSEVGWVADDSLATNAATTVGRLISNGAELQVLLNTQPSPVNDKTLIGSIERLNAKLDQMRVELAAKPDSGSLNQILQNMVITSITAVNQTVDLIQTQLQKIDGNLVLAEVEQTLRAMADFRIELANAADMQDTVRQQVHVRAQAASHSRESSRVWADESNIYAEASAESAGRAAVSSADSLLSAEASFAHSQTAEAHMDAAGVSAAASEAARLAAEAANAGALASAGAASSSAASASASAATATSQADLTAVYRRDVIRIDGNFKFDLGKEGWFTALDTGTGAVSGPLELASGFAVEVNSYRPTMLRLDPSIGAKSIFSEMIPISNTADKWELKATVAAYRAGGGVGSSSMYIGFAGLDASGGYLSHGPYGTFRYCLATPIDVTHNQVVDLSVIVTGEGNDSWVKFPPGTKNIRFMAILNYDNDVFYSYIDGFSIENVTARESAAASASASNASAASASASAASATSTLALISNVATYKLPNDFQQLGRFYSPTYQGDPTVVSNFGSGIPGVDFVVVTDGTVMRISNAGNQLVMHVAALKVLPNRIYRARIRLRNSSAGVSRLVQLELAGYGATYGYVGISGAYINIYPTLAYSTHEVVLTGNALLAGGCYYVRAYCAVLAHADNIDILELGCEDITGEATAITNAGAISTIQGAAAYWETIVAAGGGFPAVARLKAGAGGSEIDLAASKLTIYNPSNTSQYQEVARFEGGQAKLNDAIIRRLQVGPRSDSTIYFPVQLKPKIYVGSDGQTVTFEAGKTMGAPPERIVPDLTGIPVGAGEALDVRATSVSATQFTVYAKKTTPSAPTLQTTAAGTFTGGTPAVRTHKPTVADAYNSYYTFKFDVSLNLYSATEEFGGSYSAIYEGYVEFYVDSGSGWGLVGSTYIYKYEFIAGFPPGTQNYTDETYTLNWPNAIGQHGGYEFGIHPGSGANSVDLVDIQYSTQSSGTVTALTEVIPFLVYPPPND